jgi:hypothetical protein
MRKLALPFCLALTACPSDDSNSTDPTNAEGSSSGNSSSPTTNADSGSSGQVDTGSETSATTLETTVSPTTESSSESTATTEESSTGEPSMCGDGMVSGTEVCDGEDLGGNSCQSRGFMDGELVCSADCQGFSTTGCFICGDGDIQGTEECDGPIGNGTDCESLGFTAGELACDMSTCHYDTSACTTCGDGIVAGDEYCDMGNLNGNDCASIGFDGGTLGCNDAECAYDYSMCTGGSYVQDFESCAMPPEFTFSGDADWSANNTNPINGSCSAHNDNISDSQSAGMILDTLWAIDGTCNFSERTDSEDGFDYLEFYIDGALEGEWTGSGNGVTMESFPVSAGMHTLEWRFQKDGCTSQGTDTVWVDDIALMGGVPL